METAGVIELLTVIVIGLLTADVLVAQFAVDVIWHVTTAPFVKLEGKKETLLLPAFRPFTFH